MNALQPFLQRVRSKLPRLVFLLCVVQPVLDIIGYWQQQIGIGNTVTMMARMLLLGGSVLLGFLLSDRKRVYLIAALVLGVLTVGHIFACLRFDNGYVSPVTDLINLVRIYFLPLMTLCFITFLRCNRDVFPAMIRGMAADIFLIAGVQLLSTITGTDPHTYSVDQTGVLGWFLWTNSQSAILAMLNPIVICWAVRHWGKRLLPVAAVTAVSEATLYFLAPRLAFASMIGSGLFVAFCLLLIHRDRWRQALTIALVTCLFLAAIPLSPMQKRLDINDSRAALTQQRIEDMDIHLVLETETETVPSGETGEDDDPNGTKPHVVLDENTALKLETLYRSQDIIWSMVERFGRDRVFEVYDYTLDPRILSNTRLMKIRFCELLMAESELPSKLFGLNLAEMTYSRYDVNSKLVTDNYDVENDLHGIYFLTGVWGLILMLLFLLWFGIRALLVVIREPKRFFTLPICAFTAAYGLGLIHAYFTASVLRRNNASIYLAMVLAGLWYLSRKDEEQEYSVNNH
ncbi:MAG: O-antigen ligase family protein [Oscillospiraceae bacterium]|nr:O-antigen ligase family protein [Oscillospiraceae bacterium]